MPAQSASLRQQLQPPTVTTIPGSGSLSTGGTLYLWLQGRNRAGYNLPSQAVMVNYDAGDRIDITLNSTHRATGEDIYLWNLSASLTSDPTTMSQLAEIQGYEFIGGELSLTPLPVTISLSEDAHLELGATVADEASLPANADLIHGMVRGVNTYGALYRYDAGSTATLDPIGHTVLSAVGNSGRWLPFGAFNTNILNTSDLGGSDAHVAAVANPVDPPDYPADGTRDYPTDLWWLASPNRIVPAGTPFNLIVFINGTNRTQASSSGFRIEILGSVDPATGVLDAGVAQSEDWFEAGKHGAYILPADLPAGHALAVRVRKQFAADQFDGDLTNGSRITYNYQRLNQAGRYVGGLVESVIYAESDYRRIVQGSGLDLIALKGAGMVAKTEFPTQGRTPVTGVAANQANQRVIINRHGVVYVRDSAYQLRPGEAIRAIVSTAAGRSQPGAWSNYGAIAASAIVTITISHPYNEGSDRATIRADYPDERIAGSAAGELPLSGLVVYGQRQSDGEIREFSDLVVEDPTQEVQIANWSDGTLIASGPSAPSADFGLIAPGTSTASTSSGASDFIADNYRWCFAYVNDGNQISTISHDPLLGCIAEMGAPLEETVELAKFAPIVVSSPTQARAIAPAKLLNTRIVQIASKSQPFYWFDATSTEADDLTDSSPVYQPTAITGAGRIVPLIPMNQTVVTPVATVQATSTGLSATQYDPGDAVGTTPLEFANAVRESGGSALVVSAILWCEVAIAGDYRLLIFKDAIAPQTDNAALSLTDTDAKKAVGQIDFLASDAQDMGSSMTQVRSSQFSPFLASAVNTSLYGVLTVPATGTAFALSGVTGTGIEVELGVEQR